MAVLSASACVAVAVGLWATALRTTHQSVSREHLCEHYDAFRTALVADGITADTAIRARSVKLADAASQYPPVARSGEELREVLSMPDGTTAELLAASQPIAAACAKP